jgi:hypothetical protein
MREALRRMHCTTLSPLHEVRQINLLTNEFQLNVVLGPKLKL